MGPIESDANGVVRVSEGRESLPRLTFFAEHQGKQIVGVANLNQTFALKPYKVSLMSKLHRWKRPWDDDEDLSFLGR